MVMLGISGVLLLGSGVLWVKAGLVEPPQMTSPRSVEPTRPARPLDLNRASPEDLMDLPGVGPVLADRIVALRPFASVEGLTRVRGIGPKTLEGLRRYVVVGAP